MAAVVQAKHFYYLTLYALWGLRLSVFGVRYIGVSIVSSHVLITVSKSCHSMSYGCTCTFTSSFRGSRVRSLYLNFAIMIKSYVNTSDKLEQGIFMHATGRSIVFPQILGAPLLVQVQFNLIGMYIAQSNAQLHVTPCCASVLSQTELNLWWVWVTISTTKGKSNAYMHPIIVIRNAWFFWNVCATC